MKKILICEDDNDILDVCELILKEKGYEVEKCTQITDIYQLVEEVHPDLILMDLWMPEIGGEKATYLLKSSEKYKHIPIILFSANNSTAEIAKACHADGYIRKAFDIQQLEEVVELHLSERA